MQIEFPIPKPGKMKKNPKKDSIYGKQSNRLKSTRRNKLNLISSMNPSLKKRKTKLIGSSPNNKSRRKDNLDTKSSSSKKNTWDATVEKLANEMQNDFMAHIVTDLFSSKVITRFEFTDVEFLLSSVSFYIFIEGY